MELSSLHSSFFSHPSSFSNPSTFSSRRKRFLVIYCDSTKSEASGNEESRKNHIRLLQFSVTLAVISTSLPAQAKVAEKKRSSKKSEALSPEELKSWSSNLPTVGDRIPYTELLNLKREGKLKHIIKLPTSILRRRPDPVLVVLEDSRVLRTVLPTVERDDKFWEAWDSLNLNSVCINTFTPPIRKPELPSPYLGWLSNIPRFLMSFTKPKPKSKRVLELERVRKQLAEERRAEMARLREEREMMERNLRAQKKIEERRKRLETRKVKYEQSLRQARKNYRDMASMWASMARDQNVATAMGFLIFFVFYRTVVLSYRKQKKDYEDRLKIEKAEAEEKKKMRELERDMMGLEASADDEIEEKGGEQNAYLKMAEQFMKSGARVRRAPNKRLPQYMERGNDVKFKDVAGLGNIRLELEEIVKFFTHGEMYRRRGVKIPGQDSTLL